MNSINNYNVIQLGVIDMVKVKLLFTILIIMLSVLSCKDNATEPIDYIPHKNEYNVLVKEVLTATRFVANIEGKDFVIQVDDLFCFETERNIALREQAKNAGISEDSALALGVKALEFANEFLLNNQVRLVRESTSPNSLPTGEILRIVYKQQIRYDSLVKAMNLSAPRKPEIDDDEFYTIVTWVFDGDTFDFRHEGQTHRVRVLGIDCYETQKNERLAEQARKSNISIDSALALGLAAKDFAIATLRNREVLLKRTGTAPNKDVYNRYLRWVVVDGMPYDSLIKANGFDAN